MSNFEPDPLAKGPFQWMWIPREMIFSRGLAGGGSAFFGILIFVGIVYIFIAAIFSFMAAIAALIALMFVTERLDLQAEYELGSLYFALALGFMAFTCVTLVFDVVFDTSLSVPAMIRLLDEPACASPCMLANQRNENGAPLLLINDLGDFYRHTLGKEGAGFGRYALQSLPGVAVLAYVLGYALPAVPRNAGGLLRLFAAAWVAVIAALLTAFPVMVLLMMWLRGMGRS